MVNPSRKPSTDDDTVTPLWVKVSGIVGGILVLLVVIMMLLGGNHGPLRHLSGNGTEPASIKDDTPRNQAPPERVR
ncbi:hypothetical protein HNQ95_006073 [Aminobacter ciceronei]|uniref:Uncharacterized protein n=1 Tax=Aminobacter ciceronei TaxID=150723 RepID=A0ABR6CG54_9HYPH|nr:hypothetical protein [Aminobacter ciceronei]MBA9024002.1 hypothetical protein [Aminobacter ciceronei]